MADAPQTVPGDFNALYDRSARVARGSLEPAKRRLLP